MTGRRAALIVIGLLVVGIGVTFLIIGLDQADKVASVVGALVGLAGLGFSVWAYMKSASPINASTWNVDVDDSEGIQIGNRNIMEANFRDRHDGQE